MTKEELARKKGIKLSKEKQSPSDSLVTTKTSSETPQKEEPDKKENGQSESKSDSRDTKPVSPLKSSKSRLLASESTSKTRHEIPKPSHDMAKNEAESLPVSPLKKAAKDHSPATPSVSEKESAPLAAPEPAPVAAPEKRGPGKPRKRKAGDKKISFWLDEDLLHGLYDHLSYGESAGEAINVAIREYQKSHNTYRP